MQTLEQFIRKRAEQHKNLLMQPLKIYSRKNFFEATYRGGTLTYLKIGTTYPEFKKRVKDWIPSVDSYVIEYVNSLNNPVYIEVFKDFK